MPSLISPGHVRRDVGAGRTRTADRRSSAPSCDAGAWPGPAARRRRTACRRARTCGSCSFAVKVIGPRDVLGNADAVVRDIRRARRDQAHVEQAARLPRVALVDRIAVRRPAGTSDRNARRARPARAPVLAPGRSRRSPGPSASRRPAARARRRRRRPCRPGRSGRSCACGRRRRARTVDPAASTGAARSSGAATLADFADHHRRVCSASSPTAKLDIASAPRRRAAPSACAPASRRPARRRRCPPTRSLR